VPFYDDEDDDDDLDRSISVRRPTVAEPSTVIDKRVQERRQSNARVLFTIVVVIAVLFAAKPVVVPMALAVMFAFLLTPIVSVLERTFLRRVGAIVLSLGLAVTGLSLGGWWVSQQFNAVATEFAAATALNC
jgi:predicted PurR-regulated permease PerM